MASLLKIKRSATAGDPSTLAAGELAYSGLPDNGSNGGDRLYIGMGTEIAGNAANHVVIGGKYFTDMLDHGKGVLTANSAITTDASSKIDQLLVDNLKLDGNTIYSTNTDGDIAITPNGAGKTVVTNLYLDATTSLTEYVQDVTGAAITVSGGLSKSYDDAGNSIGLSIADTTVVAGTYGSTSAVPVITFNSKGQATGVSTVGISTNFTIKDSANATDVINGGETLVITGSNGISTTVTNNQVTVNASDASTATKGVASFDTGNFSVTSGAVSLKAGGVSNSNLVNSSLTLGSTSISLGSTVTSITGLDVGSSSATTRTAGDSTTAIATTAFVSTAVANAKAGLDVKESVKAATTANITLSNTQTIDGVALAVNDRVLVKNQTTGAENGIYLVQSAAWTRAADFNSSTNVTPNAFVFVEQGTTNADSGWTLTNDTAITVGTTALTFVQFSGAGQITAGNGLTKTGNTLDVGAGTGISVGADSVGLGGQALAFHNLAINGLVARTAADTVTARTLTGTANRLTITNGDGIAGNPTFDIAASYTGQNTISTLGTIATGVWNATAITVSYGGTGLSTLASRGVVFGNGTAAAGVTAASSIDGSFLREDSTGNPYWSNVIDGGTY